MTLSLARSCGVLNDTDLQREWQAMSYANRGMAFEQVIDYSNMLYERRGIAIINKRPTPIKVTSTRNGRIQGFFEKPSTVDYDGTFKGRSIVFEAKSVGQNRFPLKNLHDHQAEYLFQTEKHGAISFLLVEFRKQSEIYLMFAKSLESYWRSSKEDVRIARSLPRDAFKLHGHRVTRGRVPIDYLRAIEKVL